MVMAKRKICVVTGTRAEYGLLRWVINGIANSPVLELQLIATGMHLSPEFGLTAQEIEADGHRIDRKVEMLLSSDTPVGITKSMGVGMIGLADALAELQPHLVLVLGDRFETFAAASAALIACIPIAHIHGGEVTEGAFDDAMRHSITKMSHLHFVAAEEYRLRVVQLGEDPDQVFRVGGLGVESIKRLRPMDRRETEKALGFKFQPRNLLVTFHPVTLEADSGIDQCEELLAALAELDDVGMIFTMPNSDTGARMFAHKINRFCGIHKYAKAYTSLGQIKYLSCISHVDGVIGNSSSGLTEVPSLKKGTINIGNRQRGRSIATSVISCSPNRASIAKALDTLFSPVFQRQLESTENPYGNSKASLKIVEILEKVKMENLVRKRFANIPLI